VAGNFSLHHCLQNGSRAHPASYQMGTRGSFRRSQAAGAWSWPPPNTLSWRGAQLKHRDNFQFTICICCTQNRLESNKVTRLSSAQLEWHGQLIRLFKKSHLYFK